MDGRVVPLPSLARRPLIALYNRWLAFRSSRERSVKMVARRNDRRAFEEIFGSEDLLAEYLAPARLAFYEEVAEVCARLEPRTVIDVGCGTGHLLAAIERRLPNVERLVGVDYAAAAIRQLRTVVPGAEGIVASIDDLEVAGTFELVVSTEVLEHLHDPVGAVATLRRLCSDDGHLVVTVPDGERDDYEGHVNFWSAGSFAELLGSIGQVDVGRSGEGDLVAVVRPR